MSYRSTSQSAALDLLLKTFTNPTDIFTQNSFKHQLNTISRIGPGTTPRQCTRKWVELRSVVCKCESNAKEGKSLPTGTIGQQHSLTDTKPIRRFPSNDSWRSSTPNDEPAEQIPSSHRCGGLSNTVTLPPTPPPPPETELRQGELIIIIHVFDEAKKIKQDFACSRDVLVREMEYFAEYLTPDSLAEMDISVHCDIAIFDWLMRYTKRGLKEGPGGETLPEPQEAPQLDVTNISSILISSDFLKMEALVEECLNFFHENISQIVSLSATSINSSLMSRLVAKFTPSEVELTIDKRERFKRKMYAYLLEQFFDKSYHRTDCPQNGSTLYRCVHCCQLLTAEQQGVFPCVPHRMEVGRDGSVAYKHQRDNGWVAARAVQELQHSGYSLREIFWWLWGTVNWLVCQRCKEPFKCNRLMRCAYHVTPTTSPAQPHPCCGKESPPFSLLPNSQSGCAYREHIVLDLGAERNASILAKQASLKAVYDTLQAFKDTVCLIESERVTEQPRAPDGRWLQKESAAPLENLHKDSRPATCDTSGRPAPLVQHKLFRQEHGGGRGYRCEQSMCSYDGVTEEEGEGEEEEDRYTPKAGMAPKDTSNRSGQDSHNNEPSHSVAIQQPLEWTWDCSKSQRWNQDLQRESDELKLELLIRQLQNTCTKVVTPRKSIRSKESCGSGGIFCQLEAQFRAQQMHKLGATGAAAKNQTGSGWKK